MHPTFDFQLPNEPGLGTTCRTNPDSFQLSFALDLLYQGRQLGDIGDSSGAGRQFFAGVTVCLFQHRDHPALKRRLDVLVDKVAYEYYTLRRPANCVDGLFEDSQIGLAPGKLVRVKLDVEQIQYSELLQMFLESAGVNESIR